MSTLGCLGKLYIWSPAIKSLSPVCGSDKMEAIETIVMGGSPALASFIAHCIAFSSAQYCTEESMA